VFVFGSVYVEASPESYLKLASDERQDIDELKNCKVGHCEVQLPTEAMEL
jgi:hypothetical protein